MKVEVLSRVCVKIKYMHMQIKYVEQLGVQTGRILSDRIRIRIRKLNTDIRYPNIRADTDTGLNFNYPYPNSRYISYSLIYIMKKNYVIEPHADGSNLGIIIRNIFMLSPMRERI